MHGIIRPGQTLALLALLGLFCGPLVAQPSVSLPDSAAARGTTVSIPVRVDVDDAGADSIFAVELSFRIDPVLAPLLRLDFDQALLQDWLVDLDGSLEGLSSYLDSLRVTGAAADTIRLAAASAAAPITADGVLLRLELQVADARDPLSIPLELPQVMLNATTLGPVTGSVRILGLDGTLSVSPELLVRNQPLDLTVVDADEDRTGEADTLTVTVRNGEQTETTTLTETGSSTGIFVGSIAAVFDNGNTASGDNIVQVSQGDTVISCYEDVLDTQGVGEMRCDTAYVDAGTLGAVRSTCVAQPADTVRIQVIDPDLNADPSQLDTVSITALTMSPVDGVRDQELVVLTEIGVDADTLEGSFVLIRGAAAGETGELNAQRADTLFLRYHDVATGDGTGRVLEDTCLVVDPWGDASGDAVLQGFDASQVLFHHVGLLTLSGLEALSANVDSLAPFGPIDPFDASLILQRRVGLISSFPVQRSTAANHPQRLAAPAGRPVAETRRVHLERRGDALVLAVDDRTGIVSGDVVLTGTGFQVSMSHELSDFVLATRYSDGTVHVAFAGAEPVAGAGALLRFTGATEYIGVEQAGFNGGSITAGLGAEARVPVPCVFALMPNAPNPFNPETRIAYAVPRRVWVDLVIYNVIGQPVRTLVSGMREAGTYEAAWDGCAGDGRRLAGGTYFYRLRAGGELRLRKMTLVK